MGVVDAGHLDADDTLYLEEVFKDAGGEQRERINFDELLKCLEEIDFFIDGDLGDLVRSVVPAAAEAGIFSLDDAMKVAQAAKAQEAVEDDLPERPDLERDASLAALESSFHQQQEAGDVPDTFHPGVPDTIEEADVEHSPLEDVDTSRHSHVSGTEIFSSHPTIESEPHQRRRSIAVEIPSLRPVVDPVKRSESLMVLQYKYSNVEGPEPKQDDLPRRRVSVRGSSTDRLLEGLESTSPAFDIRSSAPLDYLTKPDLEEEALLETAFELGTDPVEVSDIPRKRWSKSTVENSFDYGELMGRQAYAVVKAEVQACLESLKFTVERHCTVARAVEEADRRAADAASKLKLLEAEKTRVDVEATVMTLVDSIERDDVVAQARDEAKRAVVEATVRVGEEAAARLAAEEKAAELVEAANIRVDVEAVLVGLMEFIERDAAIAQVRQEAERAAVDVAALAAEEAAARVNEEVEARLAAEQRVAELTEAANVRVDVEAVLIGLVESIERDAAIVQAKQEAERVVAEAIARSAEEASARVSEEVAARVVAEAKAAHLAQQAAEAIRLVAAVKEEATKKAQAAEEAEAEHMARLTMEEDARCEAEMRAKAFEEEIKKQDAARVALEQETEELRSQLQFVGVEARAHVATLAREREEAELKAQEWREKFELKAKEWEEKEAEEHERVAKEAEAEQRARLTVALEAAREGDEKQDREAQAGKKAQLHNADEEENDASVRGFKETDMRSLSRHSNSSHNPKLRTGDVCALM